MKKLLIVPMLFATLAIAAPSDVGAQCNVQKGDSLWRIAKEYHINWHRLMQLNKHLKDRNLIYPNQKIEMQLDSGQGNDQNASNNQNDHHGNVSTDNTSESDRGESATQAEAILKLVNAERAKVGAKALKLDDKLNKVAVVKAKDMAENGYFSHESPTYGSPFEMMRSFGVTQYRTAGENIAAGQRSPEDVMNSWMNSSGHRANILNTSYTNLGVGYYEGGSYGTYWVQEFTQQ